MKYGMTTKQGTAKPRAHFTLYTMQCHYNAVKFLPNPYKINPIPRPLGAIGCNLWVQTMIYTLPQSLQ